jgi:hypothetical protein
MKEMEAIKVPLYQKAPFEIRLQILKHLWQSDITTTDATRFNGYFAYYDREIAMLNSGGLKSSRSYQQMPITNHMSLLRLVEVVRGSRDERAQVLQLVASQLSADEKSTSLVVDLVLRLWLMLNVRTPLLSLQAPQTPLLRWEDAETLSTFISRTFPKSRWEIEAKTSRLSPSFNAAFMVNVCGLKIEWTNCLADHLRLDRRVNALRVFSYKTVVSAHVDTYKFCSNAEDISALPERLLRETIWSLNLLFPQWDPQINTLLKRHGQNFQQAGPYDGPPTLNLVEFQYWRDRLSELHDVVYLSPPVSWAQLWRDRRNPQQFWTFWLALVILLLTFVSTVTGVVQAWASVKALNQSS